LRTQGATSVKNLLAVVAGARPRSNQPVVLPTRLVVRGSSGRPGRLDVTAWRPRR
jgi:LacI family transcriptional regulator